MVCFLLDNGADASKRNSNGKKPIDFAKTDSMKNLLRGKIKKEMFHSAPARMDGTTLMAKFYAIGSRERMEKNGKEPMQEGSISSEKPQKNSGIVFIIFDIFSYL